jgi:Protein of unknown function (DUF4038)/Putative collagen-binding domain of a collagenase
MKWKLSGHRTGDLVEVLSKEDILATLDQHGRVDGMPFMPEMLEYCGKKFRVGAVAHKTCDTVRKRGGRLVRATVYLVLALLFICSASPLAWANVAFPIRVTDDGRHLQDANGTPFTIQAFTSWSLVTQLSIEDVETYLENRQNKGFNTVIVNLLTHRFSDKAPRNYYGVAPFTTVGDFSTPNDTYFAHAQRVLDIALRKGFLVLLTPSYFGYRGGNQGWWQEIIANGRTKANSYGRYVGNRYKTYPNIAWLLGGDYSPPSGEGETNAVEIVKGIKAMDRLDRLYTYHGARGTISTDHRAFRPFVNVNAVYSGPADVYQFCLRGYKSYKMPTFLIEAWYENEHGMTPFQLRRQAYWATTSCTAGQTVGNAPIWYFGSRTATDFADNRTVTWQAALEWPGSLDQQRLINLVRQTNSYGLVPDNDHQVVTAGYGNVGNVYVTTAMKPDKSLSLSYLPGAATVKVKLAWFSNPVTLQWYDPTTGNLSMVVGSPFAHTGTRTLRGPGRNSAGDGDWVLLATTLTVPVQATPPTNVRKLQ